MVTTRMTVSEVFDTSHTAADTDLIATYLLMVARANLKVGDHLEFPVPYKRQRQPKFAELAVLAVAHDSRRTMLVTANKSERDRAYLYQTTGKRDNLLSDNELDYINKSIGS